MNLRPHTLTQAILALLLGTLFTSCRSLQKLPGKMMADTLDGVVEAMQQNPDPETVKEGMPTMLLLIDGMIAKSPDDRDLLRQGTMAYAVFSQSFLMNPDDQLRAKRMFTQARGYGQRLLRTYPEVDAAFAQRLPAFEASLANIPPADIDNLYAAGVAWLGWILSNSGSMDAVADLPWAIAVIDRIDAIDPDYGQGLMHLFHGILYAAQPRGAGQDIPKSKSHFQKSIELAGQGALAPRVAYAEFVGKATLDEDFFKKELNEVLDTDLADRPDLRLANTLAQDRARYLLENMEEWF